MDQVHVLGCASALFDNLSARRDRMAALALSKLDCLPLAIERIRSARPDWVVYCGRAAASSWEESDIPEGDEANQVSLVARTVAEIGARMVVISSDRVFTGPRMFHDESEPLGSDAHAQSLHSIEQAALAAAATHGVLVVRTNAFGW